MAISNVKNQSNYDTLLAKYNELIAKCNQLTEQVNNQEKELKAKDALLELAAVREEKLFQIYNELKDNYTTAKAYVYGKKAEKLHYQQVILDLNDCFEVRCSDKPQITNDMKVIPTRRGTIKVVKKSYEEIYSSMKKETKVIDLEEKKCPNCGSDVEQIGVVSKTHLEYQPGYYYIVEEIRPTYKCTNKDCESIMSAEPDNSTLSSSLLTGNSIAHIMTENIMKDVPLYRQEQYLKSMGVKLSRMTMSNTFDKACFMLEPLYNSIWDYALQESLLHIDETPFNVLHTKDTNKEKKGYIWIYSNKYGSENPFVYYAFSPDRGAHNVENRLKDSTMTIMTDGYSGYSHVGEKITRACCMAHARRKFFDVIKIDSSHKKAIQFVEYFNELYEIEEKIKGLDNASKLKIRQEESRVVFDNILKMMHDEMAITIPTSAYGKALSYLCKFRNELQIYLNDGNVPIDNNQAERMAKYFVMYRKNSLFANTEDGANRTAMLHTIIQSARLNGLSIEKYLSLLFTEFEQITTKEIPKYYPWSDYVKQKCKIENEKMDN